MNQYLFLFPIKEYFRACMDFFKLFEIDGHKPTELIDIIHARYKNNGFGINWLLFSKEEDPSLPDLSQIPDYLEINDDRILTAGVSFKRHISKKKYADQDYVLNQLPPHEKLVIGGFHQWDCVDKIAKRSYERGIETLVDEDTTELFFGAQALYGIPLIRTDWSLKGLGISEHAYEFVKGQRKNKPWFVHD